MRFPFPKGPVSSAADSLLLDQYPESYAAYSLRKLRSDYGGPAVRVRRSLDGAEQDIGFTGEGWVDTTAISSFVASGDGYATTWYAQVDGTPDLTQSTNSQQPRIAQGRTVETDVKGKPVIYFDGPDSEDPDYLEASGFSSSTHIGPPTTSTGLSGGRTRHEPALVVSGAIQTAT